MPSRAELQPDMSTLHPVNNSVNPPSAPAMPDATPRSNPQIRTTLAPIQQMQPDQQRQFFKGGTPQFRISPPPTTANPSINSSASGITKRATDPLGVQIATTTAVANTAAQSTFLGPWQATVQYLANNQVSRNGNTYLAVDTSTGSQPPSADWFLLGPSNFDSILNGVVSVKPTQYSVANVTISNSTFEASTSLDPTTNAPPGWVSNGAAATLSYDTATPFSGTQSLKVAASAVGGGAKTTQIWSCKPGDSFFVSCAMKSDGTSQPRALLIFLNAGGAFVGAVGPSHGTGTSWTTDTASGVAPAGAASFYFECDSLVASGVAEFDNCLADRMVDPTTTVVAKGSTPSNLSSGFSYTSTTTTVNISWSGLTIYRADGTTTAIPNSSVLITGLTASTTYHIYPYYDEAVNLLTFVVGGVGSPSICQLAGSNAISQAQNLQSHVPLSSSTGFVVATTASGGGGGTGGGSGSCLHKDMLVETKRGVIPIIEVEIGDQVRGESDWQTVTYKKVRPAEIFLSVQLTDGSEIVCTPSHPFTMPAGSDVPMKRAQDLSLSDFLITTQGVGAIRRIEVVEAKAQKVTLTVEPSHTFFAGKDSPQILTHNYLPS
jgi:hypothetical protein